MAQLEYMMNFEDQDAFDDYLKQFPDLCPPDQITNIDGRTDGGVYRFRERHPPANHVEIFSRRLESCRANVLVYAVLKDEFRPSKN